MPLKDGKMPTDSLVDVSAASKTDRQACNKVLCNLGYSREDNIRYPKIIQQVYGRLKEEEGGDGNKAQQRNLYKKLTQCKDNYPSVEEIPNKQICKTVNGNTSSSYTPPPSSYKPPPKSHADANDKYLAKNNLTRLTTTFINASFHSNINKLHTKLYELYNLIIRTKTLILNTNDPPLIKKMDVIHKGMASIINTSDIIANKHLWDEIMKYFNSTRVTYTAFIEKKPKTPKAPKTAKVPKSPKARKGPKTAKAPTPPPKAPRPPRANSTRKRCPNGTHRNKKTGNCEAK